MLKTYCVLVVDRGKLHNIGNNNYIFGAPLLCSYTYIHVCIMLMKYYAILIEIYIWRQVFNLHCVIPISEIETIIINYL